MTQNLQKFLTTFRGTFRFLRRHIYLNNTGNVDPRMNPIIFIHKRLVTVTTECNTCRSFVLGVKYIGNSDVIKMVMARSLQLNVRTVLSILKPYNFRFITCFKIPEYALSTVFKCSIIFHDNPQLTVKLLLFTVVSCLSLSRRASIYPEASDSWVEFISNVLL